MSAEPLDLAALRDSADSAAALLRVLCNPDRLLLLCQLTHGEACVSDLEAATGIAQPTLSQQLGVLREAQLVTTRREGKNIFYALDSDDALAVMEVLDTRFCQKRRKRK